MEVGFRDFDVVAEYVIEPDLERLDAGAVALARFDGGDVAFAVAADVAEFIKFGVDTGADGAAIDDCSWWFVGNAFKDCIAYLGSVVEALFLKKAV